jgi:DNA-directed RNA polymerase subunit RPC12/RpoP
VSYTYSQTFHKSAKDWRNIPSDAHCIVRESDDEMAFARCESCGIPLFDADNYQSYIDHVYTCAKCSAPNSPFIPPTTLEPGDGQEE